MAQAANIIQYVQIGFGRQTQAYGAWYEGEQQKDYYETNAAITNWQRQNLHQETEAAAERDIRAAGALQLEAKNAQYEADAVRKISGITEKRHQDETDAGISRAYARIAKSGASTTFGSPMEFLNKTADERAMSYGMTKWQNEMSVWGAERKVQGLTDKASIMLDQAALTRWQYQNAAYAMNYQALLYKMAAKEAKKAAKYKEISHYIGAVTDSLNVFMGSGGGNDMFGDMMGQNDMMGMFSKMQGGQNMSGGGGAPAGGAPAGGGGG